MQKLIERIDKLEGKLSAANEEDFRRGRTVETGSATTVTRRDTCQKSQGGPGKQKTLGALSRATRQGAQNNGISVTITLILKNTVPTLVESSNSASSCSLKVQVNNVVASCLIDTGAAVSLISHELWVKMEQENTGLKLRQTSRE